MWVGRWLLCSLISAVLLANSSEHAVVTASGQRPYLVVYPDAQGSSQREPGIYAADRLGKWNPIIHGTPLMSRDIVGILAQLPIQAHSGRFESLAVVQNKLVLFNINSPNSKDRSVIEIGSAQYPVRDLLSNGTVLIPEVKSFDDVRVYAASPSALGQLVLISLKYPQPTPMGEGITLALQLKPNTDPNDATLEIKGDILAIDYTFQNKGQLHRLHELAAFMNGDNQNPKGPYVASRTLLGSVTRSLPDDPPKLQSWRQQIERFNTILMSQDAYQRVQEYNPPFLEVGTGRKSIQQLILSSARVGQTTGYLMQFYDPITGMDGMGYFLNSSLKGVDLRTAIQQHGRLALRQGKPVVFMDAGGNAEHLITVLNSKIYFVKTNNQTPSYLALSAHLENLPKNFEGNEISYYVTPEGINKKDSYFIFLSDKLPGREQTEVFHVEEVKGNLTIKHHFPIASRFYSPLTLKLRVATTSYGEVLFDTITPQPEIESEAAFRQQSSLKTPRLSVSQTTDPNYPIQTYLEPEKEEELGKNLYYRIFNQEGANTDQSGVYYGDKGTMPKCLAFGELLRKNEQNVVVATKKLKIDKMGDFALSIYAIDANAQKGANGFSMITTLVTEDARYDKKITTIQDNMPIQYEKYIGTQVFQGGKGFSDWIYVFHRMENFAGTLMPATMLYLYRLNEDKSDKDKRGFRLELQKAYVVSQDRMSSTEVVSRIKRESKEGKLFFVQDPSLDATDPNYKLIDLHREAVITPNQGAEKHKKYVSLEVEEIDKGELGFSGHGSWYVQMSHDLKERYPKAFEGFDIFDEKKQRIEKVYEGLERWLDEAADPSKKPQHSVWIVPDYFKDGLWKTMLRMYIMREKRTKFWANLNYKFRFSILNRSKATQQEIISNMEALKKVESPDHGLLLVDAKDLIDVGRPQGQGEEDTWAVISDPTDQDESSKGVLPHILYWLATEGEYRPLKNYEEIAGKTPKKVPMLLVATRSEWRTLMREADMEEKNGVFKSFDTFHRYDYGTWKLWPPKSPFESSGYFRNIERNTLSNFEKQMFPALEKSLIDASSPSVKPKHQVLLIPQDLKQSAFNYLLTRWNVLEKEKESKGYRGWSRGNKDLNVHILGTATKTLTQAEVMNNLRSMRAARRHYRSPLVVDLSTVSSLGNNVVVSDTREFRLKDVVGSKTKGETSLDDVDVQTVTHYPHLLYLLATEGQRVQVGAFEEAMKRGNQIPMLLMGTREEWENSLSTLTVEKRVKLEDYYEVVELPVPDPKARTQLLKEVVQRLAAQGIVYKFKPDGLRVGDKTLSEDETIDTVLGYLVNRAERIAKTSKEDVISSFTRLIREFQHTLMNNEEYRISREFGRSQAEAILAKVFSVPLNLETLPPNDPLKIFSSPNAVALFQREAEYDGPYILKAQVLETLLKQTKSDPVRMIPSSMILYGPSRTGKTSLFRAICKIGGLKYYDYADPSNDEAQAIIINVAKLKPSPEKEKEKDKKDPESIEDIVLQAQTEESMTVKQAMAHLRYFLTRQKGHRGYILFDDVSAAQNDAIRAAILSEIRTLFEAKNGLYKIDMGKEIKEVPVKNLSLFMTVNPPSNNRKLREFRTGEGSDYDYILAALAGDGKDAPIDRSFLERWGLVLNLSQFPTEAKLPTLLRESARAARIEYDNRAQLIIVSPQAARTVATEFKENNANLLSKAVPEFIYVGSDLPTYGPLSLVVPTSALPKASMGHWYDQWPMNSRTGREATGSDNARVESYIRNNLVAVSVADRLDGQLLFLQLLANNFRVFAFESLFKEITQDPRYASDPRRIREMLVPFVHSMHAHLWNHGDMPLGIFQLDPVDFKQTSIDAQSKFRAMVDAFPMKLTRYFPIFFGDDFLRSGRLDGFLGAANGEVLEGNRAKVLSETTRRLMVAFHEAIADLLRVKDIQNLPDPAEWLVNLPSSDLTGFNRKFGKALLSEFIFFFNEFNRDDLSEILHPERFRDTNFYDTVRFFFLAVDKTIAKIRWAPVTYFLLKAIDQAGRDMTIGQKNGVQMYFFESAFSLLKSQAYDLTLQVAESSDAYRAWKESERTRFNTEFSHKCAQALVQPDVWR